LSATSTLLRLVEDADHPCDDLPDEEAALNPESMVVRMNSYRSFGLDDRTRSPTRPSTSSSPDCLVRFAFYGAKRPSGRTARTHRTKCLLSQCCRVSPSRCAMRGCLTGRVEWIVAVTAPLLVSTCDETAVERDQPTPASRPEQARAGGQWRRPLTKGAAARLGPAARSGGWSYSAKAREIADGEGGRRCRCGHQSDLGVAPGNCPSPRARLAWEATAARGRRAPRLRPLLRHRVDRRRREARCSSSTSGSSSRSGEAGAGRRHGREVA
jgi:hypothetical protein